MDSFFFSWQFFTSKVLNQKACAGGMAPWPGSVGFVGTNFQFQNSTLTWTWTSVETFETLLIMSTFEPPPGVQQGPPAYMVVGEGMAGAANVKCF